MYLSFAVMALLFFMLFLFIIFFLYIYFTWNDNSFSDHFYCYLIRINEIFIWSAAMRSLTWYLLRPIKSISDLLNCRANKKTTDSKTATKTVFALSILLFYVDHSLSKEAKIFLHTKFTNQFEYIRWDRHFNAKGHYLASTLYGSYNKHSTNNSHLMFALRPYAIVSKPYPCIPQQLRTFINVSHTHKLIRLMSGSLAVNKTGERARVYVAHSLFLCWTCLLI